MPPMPFPIPPLFNTAVKDICAINTFEKLLHILFSEVYCWYFGFTTLLFSTTITDMSLYELLNLFPRWPLVFRSFLHSPLVAHDVITPKIHKPEVSKKGIHSNSRGIIMKALKNLGGNKDKQLSNARGGEVIVWYLESGWGKRTFGKFHLSSVSYLHRTAFLREVVVIM